MSEAPHPRGSDPRDAELFAPGVLPRLRVAVDHLSWLLSHDYAPDCSLELVGNRFQLRARQRMAVGRSACSDAALADRHRRRLDLSDLAGRRLAIDGFNVLTTVEVALVGGLVLQGRDRCLRDLAGLHGEARRGDALVPALEAVAALLAAAAPSELHWWFDRPVPHSQRLAELVGDHARERGLPWRAELAADPDRLLCECEDVVASADRRVLDGCRAWFDLAREVVAARVPRAWWVDLGSAADTPSGP